MDCSSNIFRKCFLDIISMGQLCYDSRYFPRIFFAMGVSTTIDSLAVGMALARPYGFQIDFVRNRISDSAALFLLIILKFIP